MGLARGINAGTRMAQGWIGAFRAGQQMRDEADLKGQQKAIMAAQPEELTGFTEEQGAQLRGLDPNQYDIGYDQDAGAYTVTSKADPAMTRTISPQQQHLFLGNRSASAYSPEQIQQMRGRALADARMAYDPELGLKMRGQVDDRYRQDKALADAEALKGKTQEYYARLSELPTADLVKEVGHFINGDPDLPAMLTLQDGRLYLDSRIPGLPTQEVSRADLINMAGQAFQSGNGDVRMGMQALLAQLEATQKRHEGALKTRAELAHKDAQTANQLHQIDDRDARTRLDRERTDSLIDYRDGQLEQGGLRLGMDAAYKGGRLDNDTRRTEAYVNRQQGGATDKLDSQGQADLARLKSLAQVEEWPLEKFSAASEAIHKKSRVRQHTQTAVIPALRRALAAGKTTPVEAVRQLQGAGYSDTDVIRILQEAGVRVPVAAGGAK